MDEEVFFKLKENTTYEDLTNEFVLNLATSIDFKGKYSNRLVREAAKKVLLLMFGPLRPCPPPLPELNGRWNLATK